MTKVQWLEKQIEAASEGFPDLDAEFIPKFVAAVKSSGENISRSSFMELFESFAPSGGPAHCDYMMLDTQLCYVADFSEAWDIPVSVPLPELKVTGSHNGVELPSDFVKIGGAPDWLQDESYPSCDQCNADMSLLVQLKSPPNSTEYQALEGFRFGDLGSVYLFTCCGTYKTAEQGH